MANITSSIIVAFEKMNREISSMRRVDYKIELAFINKNLKLKVMPMRNLDAFKI